MSLGGQVECNYRGASSSFEGLLGPRNHFMAVDFTSMDSRTTEHPRVIVDFLYLVNFYSQCLST